jgi:hypothetical protein
MMYLKKITLRPVDQQGRWLEEVNEVLANATKVEMYLKPSGQGDDKTIVILAICED